jgi:hypothetical protein
MEIIIRLDHNEDVGFLYLHMENEDKNREHQKKQKQKTGMTR